MPTCFVIQPFDDGGPFDKRFNDTYTPAIEAAGLKAYRVDRDPKTEVLIDAIEQGIQDAAICLADITTNNPNVWYELGYAFALRRPVVIVVCSGERHGGYPFDIQHRPIISYKSEAPTDYDHLKKDITERLTALLGSSVAVERIAKSEQVAPTDGLTQHELMLLVTLAGDTGLPGSSTSMWRLKNDVEASGLTSIGFALAFRRLASKGFVESFEDTGDVRLTDTGWAWIDRHESLFILKKVDNLDSDEFDGNIPF
nr:hypothetical protein [Ferrimicrobium acidiphilum]